MSKKINYFPFIIIGIGFAFGSVIGYASLGVVFIMTILKRGF